MPYLEIRTLHIVCVMLSISLFIARASMQFAGIDWRKWRWLKILPHANDSLLLGAAISLSLYSHQYPFAQAWLGAKVIALLIYIILGGLTLRQNLSLKARVLSFIGALLVFGYILGVAHSRSVWLNWFI